MIHGCDNNHQNQRKLKIPSKGAKFKTMLNVNSKTYVKSLPLVIENAVIPGKKPNPKTSDGKKATEQNKTFLQKYVR